MSGEKKLIALLGSCFCLCTLVAQPAQPERLQVFCHENESSVKRLLGALDLDKPGLEKVRLHASSNSSAAACAALLDYFKNKTVLGLTLPAPPTFLSDASAMPEAVALLEDRFTLQGVQAAQKKLPSGGLDWSYMGPRKDKEWAYLLNRHLYFDTLRDAYWKTGDPRFAACFDRHLRDWLSQNPTPFYPSWSTRWGVMGAGCRLKYSWPFAFYGFQQARDFSDETRLLMLAAIPEHAEYVRRFHSWGGNHLLAEMCGLASAAVFWPEFKRSEVWLQTAREIMEREIQAQFYQDGAYKELSNHYHVMCLRYIEQFRSLLSRAESDFSPAAIKKIEAMWDYTAYIMNPLGKGPLNNDADAEANFAAIIDLAQHYGRADWDYIARSGRYENVTGTPPPQLSRYFPWAGQAIMRDGWLPNSLWLFFDMGPMGTAHGHRDKLHIALAAHGRELLVDSGRYSYKRDAWRQYFTSSQGHNVILVNGNSQRLEQPESRAANDGYFISEGGFDFARGDFIRGFENRSQRATHRRAVLNVRGEYWVVADEISAFGKHRLDALWHFHPDATVVNENGTAVSTDMEKGNLRIMPVPAHGWKLSLARGVERPSIQGWWSESYNVKRPATAAVFSSERRAPSCFAWVLLPARGSVEFPSVTHHPSPAGWVYFSVRHGGQADQIAIRLRGDASLKTEDGATFSGELLFSRNGKRLFSR